MGCTVCKSGKAIMPVVSKLEIEIVKDFCTYLSSHNPNASYPSDSNINQNPIEEKNPPLLISSSNPYTDRSCKSDLPLTASTEFKKFLQNSSDFQNSLQKEYKIYVWTKNRKALRRIFPDRSFNQTLEINGKTIEANFSIYTSTVPIVVDCIVYILEKIEDFKEVYRVNQQFKHVWVHALFSVTDQKSVLEASETLGIQLLKSSQELFRKICEEDLRLLLMLKEMFGRIDEDGSGEIEFEELVNGFRRIQEDISLEEIREGLKKIDLDSNGRISFEELCFWWKKGRQGPLSFSNSVLSCAKTISISNPETRLLLRKMTINRPVIEKKLKKKEILINVGGKFEPKTEILIELGKSSAREKILNEINSRLSLFSQELWLTVHIKANPEKNVESCLQKIKKQAGILIESITNTFIDGSKLKRAIEFDIQSNESDFFLTFSLNTEDEFMEPVNKLLITLDEVCTSPTNDSIFLKYLSNVFFYQLFNKGDFFGNLGTALQVSIEIEHWNKYLSLFYAAWPDAFKFKGLVTALCMGNTKIRMDFLEARDFCNSFDVSHDFSELLTPGLLHFFHELASLFADDVAVFIRCSNLGAKIKIKSKELLLKLSQQHN